MNNDVRRKLIELARIDKTITYQELSDVCQLGLRMSESPYDRAEIGTILGEISTFEHKNNRPMLSSLVLTKGSNYEGDGFYKLAEELGFGPWRRLRADLFEIEQMKKCFDFWQAQENYTMYGSI